MLSAISVVLSIAAGTLFVALLRKRRGQHLLFARMGVAGPQPSWLSGSIKQTKHATLLHELLIEWRQTYGKTFGYYEGPIPVLVTSDLDIIREVFIKQFNNFHGRKLFPLQPDPEDPKTNHMFTARGSKWRRLRGIISPTFSSTKLRQTMPIINKKVDVLLHQMAIQAVREQSMDMLGTFQALTMEVIGSAAFGMDLNSQTDPNEPFLTKAKDMLELFEKGSVVRSIAEYLPELRPCLVRFLSAVITITKATPAPVWFLKNLADVIAMRREENETWKSGRPKRVDMMQLMLEAEVEDPNLDINDNSLDSNTHESSVKRSSTMPCLATIENGKPSPSHSPTHSPTYSPPHSVIHSPLHDPTHSPASKHIAISQTSEILNADEASSSETQSSETCNSELHGSGTCSSELHGSGTCSSETQSSETCNSELHGSETCSSELHGSETCSSELHGSGTCSSELHGSGTCSSELHGSQTCSSEIHGSQTCSSEIDGLEPLSPTSTSDVEANNNIETQSNHNFLAETASATDEETPLFSTAEVETTQTARIYANGLQKKTTKKLTTDEIKGQSFLFLVAGYETTAHTLSFACYLLARHPQVQDTLRREVDAYFEEEKEIQYDSLGKMQYLDMVVSETLRIYPIANIVVNRLCMRDTVVGELSILEGTVVQANVMDVHMDPEIWGPHDPRDFYPERFHPDLHSQRDPLAYMPFGVGPRNCVGMRFALLEVKLALARLVRHFCFLTCAETQIPLQVKEVPALTPTHGIKLRVVARGQHDLIR